MPDDTTTRAGGHVARRETRPWGALQRLLLLTSALSAIAGAVLANAVLDRLADASAPPRLPSGVIQAPVTAGGRDPGVPDAGSVFFGPDAPPDDPAASD